MKKIFLPILILSLTLVVFFGSTEPAHASVGSDIVSAIVGGAGDIIGTILSPLGYTIMKLVSRITMLAGVALNASVYYTVIQMAQNFANLPAIDETWGVVRDIANMGFIFILLYASIKLILGTDNDVRQLIVRMIIAAILINFSLFFTKVIIDAANLLALTFYNAIAPAASLGPDNFLSSGISNAMVDAMQLSTLWSSNTLINGANVFMTTILSSVVLIISAFSFLAIAIMLVIRYVVLIFVLILSPIAFVSDVLPGLKGPAKKWWDALTGQAFFAPIYFFLTWIVIRLANGLNIKTAGGWASVGASTYTPGLASTIINFGIIIMSMVGALMLAKSWADKAGSGVSKLTSQALGFTTGTLIGGSLRNTAGRFGKKLENNPNLITAANERTGFAGAGARLALYASKKTAGATFDARNANVPTGVISDSIRGTFGRTNIGKKMGLDEFDTIKSINVGAPVAGVAGAGKGGTTGFRENSAEDKKKWDKVRAEQSEEARKAQNNVVIRDNLPIVARVDTATAAEAAHGRTYIPTTAEKEAVGKFEKSIASMTDKEIEAMVDGDRDLLKSQAFATKISVQQLEALNKSEKFNETEKDTLKKTRFSVIAKGLSSLEVPEAVRTDPEKAAAKAASGAIKGLADKELEMLDADTLGSEEFVSELRSAQVESIGKSSKFTPSQKKSVKNARNTPLMRALDTATAGHAPDPALVNEFITKKLSPKDVAGLMSKDITPTAGGPSTKLLLHPDVLNSLKPNILKRMAPEMTGADITTLRTALLGAHAVGSPVERWLKSPDGLANFQ